MTHQTDGADNFRDVDLVDLQLQNAATWSVLDNAVQVRELAIWLHGGAIALAPFVVAVADSNVAAYTALVGVAFLAVMSFASFLSIDSLRLLQFRLGVEEGRARLRLRGGVATYATETNLHPPSLRLQRDPMGIATRSMLAVASLDVLLLGVVTGAAMTDGSSTSVRVAVTCATAVAAVFLIAGMLVWSGRHSSAAAARVASELSPEAEG